jgi:hypothetical protein
VSGYPEGYDRVILIGGTGAVVAHAVPHAERYPRQGTVKCGRRGPLRLANGDAPACSNCMRAFERRNCRRLGAVGY